MSGVSNNQDLKASARTPDNGDLREKERQEGWAVPIDRVAAFTLGAAISVEPDKIEQELSALWRKAAERAKESGDRFAVTRACLWNFIAHSDGETEFQKSKRMLDEVSETVPTRIISLHETSEGDGSGELIGDDGAPVRAYVEANFRRSGSGRREVVAEEITLEVHRIQGQRLPGLVRSLLLPDVPTAMFVRNPAADYQWLPRLLPETDRLIFDSEKLSSARALHAVVELCERMVKTASASGTFVPVGHALVPRFEVADLGWLRLWPWRILVASLFDSPAAAAALTQLSALRIEYGKGAEPAAYLLAGWLESRLHLAVHEKAVAPGRYTAERSGHSGPPVTLDLVEVAPAETPVGIVRVTIAAGGLEFVAEGVSGETRCVVVRSPHMPERVQPVHGRRDSELMVAAMGVGGRDPLMYEALRLGAELAQKGNTG